MITITITTQGFPEANANLVKLEGQLSSLKPLWEKLGEEFYGQEKALFEAQPWKPLSPAYAKRKRAKFGDKPILVATGLLLGSLTKKGAEGNVHRVSDLDAEFGSAVPYGIFHQDSRPPIGEPKVEEYRTIAAEYMVEAVRNSGFN